MRTINADIIVALLAVAVGGATLLLVPDQVGGASLAAVTNAQSAAFFPILAALLMLICGCVLLVEGVVDQRRGGGVHVTILRPAAVAIAVCIVVGLAIGTHFIGMSLASGVAILAMGLFIEPARWRLIVPTAVVVPIVIYMLFERLLLILLPEGTLL